jgi:hypothetical protein
MNASGDRKEEIIWRDIPGYAYPYRIRDRGEVQQFRGGAWKTISVRVTRRAQVILRKPDGTQRRLGVFRLLDELFNDGYARKHGLCVSPKNGVKSECTLENLTYKTRAEIGRESWSRGSRRPVMRTDRNGNVELYPSVIAAAKASGLTVQSLDRRLYHGVLDPRGYRWKVLK